MRSVLTCHGKKSEAIAQHPASSATPDAALSLLAPLFLVNFCVLPTSSESSEPQIPCAKP